MLIRTPRSQVGRRCQCTPLRMFAFVVLCRTVGMRQRQCHRGTTFAATCRLARWHNRSVSHDPRWMGVATLVRRVHSSALRHLLGGPLSTALRHLLGGSPPAALRPRPSGSELPPRLLRCPRCGHHSPFMSSAPAQAPSTIASESAVTNCACLIIAFAPVTCRRKFLAAGSHLVRREVLWASAPSHLQSDCVDAVSGHGARLVPSRSRLWRCTASADEARSPLTRRCCQVPLVDRVGLANDPDISHEGSG